MKTYGVSTWDTSETITEGLQGRDGYRWAARIAEERGEPVSLWCRETGLVWCVEANGEWIGWDNDAHRELPDQEGPEGA